VTAYLVAPPGEGMFAGLIYAHPGDGDRGYFLDEAVAMAPAGVVSLLVDAPWVRPEPWRYDLNYTPANDRDVYIQHILDLRRGIDVLVTHGDVDPERLGFVGYSAGAHAGGVLAGVETRLAAYVLMAGLPTHSDRVPRRISSVWSNAELTAYMEAIRPLDAVHYIGYAAPAALYFQSARQDEIITVEDTIRFYDAASEPKELVWYDAGHRLNEQAHRDRTRWLMEQLGL
jgi:dienelactone hydrolase